VFKSHNIGKIKIIINEQSYDIELVLCFFSPSKKK